MGAIERKTIYRLRKRVAFLVTTLIILFCWMNNLREDKEWIKSESDQLRLVVSRKDEHIKILYRKMDSLKNAIDKHIEIKNKKLKKINRDTTSTILKRKDTLIESNQVTDSSELQTKSDSI